MSIPKILALDINYDISREELEKTIKLNLNIDKNQFEDLNVTRKNNNLSLITLEQVQQIIYKGKVEYKDDNFHFQIDSSDEDKELTDIIQPLLKIEIDYFKVKNTHLLHLASELPKLMEHNNYKEIVNSYYKNIRENCMINEIGEENYKKIKSGEHKFSIVFKTLLNEPLKQIDELFLPTISKNNDNVFYQEKEINNEHLDNKEIYKYNIYIPENYLWEIPVDMEGKPVKINNVKYSIRYLTIDEINEKSLSNLLEDSDYLESMGKVITSKTVNLDIENPFESNWSNEDIKENNANVQINILPKLVKNKDGDISLTQPGDVKDQLLKLFIGLNNKFFNQKIISNNTVSQVQSS